MFRRREFKANAKIRFKRNYWGCVGAAVIAFGCNTVIGRVITILERSIAGYTGGSGTGYVIGEIIVWLIRIMTIFFVTNVMVVGTDSFFIKNRMENGEISDVLSKFNSEYYGNIVKIMFLEFLYMYLWSLLFIIPGIVKFYEYRMIPYILAENPGMNSREVFEVSKRMMNGKKWEMFVLDLSFIGWAILGIITCGIAAVFFVMPYKNATDAEVYAFNKVQAYTEGYIR